MAWKRPGTSERGYGAQHQALRKLLLPRAIGTPCTRCSKPLRAGQDIDLDHTDDRRGYRGFSHAECNRRAGGQKAHRQPNPQPRSATRW